MIPHYIFFVFYRLENSFSSQKKEHIPLLMVLKLSCVFRLENCPRTIES